MIVTSRLTLEISTSGVSYLQPFVCELQYAPGKWRPEVFYFPRDTQPGHVEVNNGQFIRVIERLNPNLKQYAF